MSAFPRRELSRAPVSREPNRRMSVASAFSLQAALITAAIGFAFGVLGIMVTQYVQRRNERRTIGNAIQVEVLRLGLKLVAFKKELDKLPHEVDLTSERPTHTIS